MSIEAQFLCYLLAFVSFVLAAVAAPVPRVNLIGLGLTFWVLIPLYATLEAM